MKQILLIITCSLTQTLISGMQDTMYIMEDDSTDNYENPIYSYFYSVNNPKTGDLKSHHETRAGSMVKGFYKVADPEGTMREVRAFFIPGRKTGYQENMYTMPNYLNTQYPHFPANMYNIPQV